MSSKILKNTIEILKSMDINGETMEQLIRDLGMEDQMLRQLAMKVDIDELRELMDEKERLEGEKIQTYNIETYSTVKVTLSYRGIEYEVECRTYDFDGEFDVTFTVRTLDDGQELHRVDPLYYEIVEYVDSQVIGNIRK
jgi:hypothetical protein